jgi:copper(I)-binding protein
MYKVIGVAISGLLFAVSGVAAHQIESHGLEITHPWVRETPKGTDVTAGYVKIKNTGKEADRLIDASLKGASKAELHGTVVEDGVSKMRLQPNGLPILPGETLELKTGGFHMMFLGLKTTLNADEYVDGSLTFEKAGKVPVEFYVESLSSEGKPRAEHEHH